MVQHECQYYDNNSDVNNANTVNNNKMLAFAYIMIVSSEYND